MKRIFSIIASLMMFILFVPAKALSAPDPLTCVGYDTPRVFVDDQSWWLRTPGKNGTDNGHVHVATCFPLFQTVKGTVPFDIRLTMHMNPGRIDKLTIHVESPSGGEYVLVDKFFSPGLTCATTCDFWVHLDANTLAAQYDGWQRFTFRTIVVEPDGNETHNGSGYRAFINNGKTRKDTASTIRTTGKGWYTQTLYANSSIDNYSYGSSKSGVWAAKIICNASKTVTGCLVTIDPDFHNGNEGTVLLRKSASFTGTVNIDTSKFPNGQHKLVIKTDVNDPRGSTLSGVLGLPFTVQN